MICFLHFKIYWNSLYTPLKVKINIEVRFKIQGPATTYKYYDVYRVIKNKKKKKQKLHASYLILFFLVILFWLLLLFRFVGFRFLIRLTGSNILLGFLRLTIIIINAENCESWWHGGRHFCELWIYVLITKTTELPVSL